MIKSHPLLVRTAQATLVAVPLGIMAVLATNILWPSLRKPWTKFYGSRIGYPALQRLMGEAIEVETVPVQAQQLQQPIAAPGESVPLKQVEIRHQLSGPVEVEQVFVHEGQRVRKGQLLLKLEQKRFQNAVNTARNNLARAEVVLAALQSDYNNQVPALRADVKNARDRLEIARLQFEKVKAMFNEGIVSQFQVYNLQESYLSRQGELQRSEAFLNATQSSLHSQIREAQLQIHNSQIALAEAELQLQRTQVYATTNGLVSRLQIDGGEVPGGPRFPLLTLAQDIVFQAYVDQTHLNTIQVGDRAEVRLVSEPGKAYTGKVIQINPTVITNYPHYLQDSRNRLVGVERQYTYAVWVEIPGTQMPPGLQGFAQFAFPKSSLVVPESSVVHLSAGEGMVMVMSAGKATVRRVHMGKTFGQQREILHGLQPGEQVVLYPRALNPGDRLQSKPNPEG